MIPGPVNACSQRRSARPTAGGGSAGTRWSAVARPATGGSRTPPTSPACTTRYRSSWTPGNYCYLQDLFVADSARGLGLGRALIEAVYDKARAAGASRVHWLTQTSNAQARILYDQVADDSGFMQYRKIF